MLEIETIYLQGIIFNKIVTIFFKHLLISEATVPFRNFGLHPQRLTRITAVSTYGHISAPCHLRTCDGYRFWSSNTVIFMNVTDEDEWPLLNAGSVKKRCIYRQGTEFNASSTSQRSDRNRDRTAVPMIPCHQTSVSCYCVSVITGHAVIFISSYATSILSQATRDKWYIRPWQHLTQTRVCISRYF